MTQGEVAKSIPNGEIADLNKSEQSAATHATDFDPPIYDPDSCGAAVGRVAEGDGKERSTAQYGRRK